GFLGAIELRYAPYPGDQLDLGSAVSQDDRILRRVVGGLADYRHHAGAERNSVLRPDGRRFRRYRAEPESAVAGQRHPQLPDAVWQRWMAGGEGFERQSVLYETDARNVLQWLPGRVPWRRLLELESGTFQNIPARGEDRSDLPRGSIQLAEPPELGRRQWWCAEQQSNVIGLRNHHHKGQPAAASVELKTEFLRSGVSTRPVSCDAGRFFYWRPA